MDTFTFESIEEFCEMLDDVLTDSTETISVVAKYNDAKEIIKELVLYGYDFGYIHLDYEYPNEYEVMIINDRIYCDKLKRDGEYITSCATAIYAMEDVNSKCILRSYPDAKTKILVQIEPDDEELGDHDDDIDYDACEYKDDCDVRFTKDEDGKVHGMTVSSSDGDRYISHSIYCTDAFDQNEMLDFLADTFGL